jgi:hypothetical protein
MNENTLVTAHGYGGDAHQIKMLLPYMLHHQCPIAVISPTDSPIGALQVSVRREVSFRSAGKRAYIGQDSLDRQKLQMQLLLRHYPQAWFLMNDSDSVCLSPKIPDYVYQDPNIVWSNVVDDSGVHPMAERLKNIKTTFPDQEPVYPWPQLAFQPPYFMHRSAIEKIVAVADSVRADCRTPFLDWAIMAWTVKAGLAYKGFPDGASCATCPELPGGLETMARLVREEGKIFVHSVKTLPPLLAIAHARLDYKRTHGL